MLNQPKLNRNMRLTLQSLRDASLVREAILAQTISHKGILPTPMMNGATKQMRKQAQESRQFAFGNLG
jgi:hypothetical protein